MALCYRCAKSERVFGAYCRPCKQFMVSNWKSRNPEAVRRSNRKGRLKRAYNMTVSEWDAMFVSQGKCCGICGISETPKWDTDHDHNTGRVRGILCSPCNLGLSEHIEVNLKNIARYLDLEDF